MCANRNYPAYTPRGGVLIEGMTVFKSGIGVFCKNGYRYVNDSPYFEDGQDGRSSQRYTVRNAVLIGCENALMTINGPTKMHAEKSVIAGTPPANLYPKAAADAYTGKEFRTSYRIGMEGKHLPGETHKWSITVCDETLAAARNYGFRTREEIEAMGIKFHQYGYPYRFKTEKAVKWLGLVDRPLQSRGV